MKIVTVAMLLSCQGEDTSKIKSGEESLSLGSGNRLVFAKYEVTSDDPSCDGNESLYVQYYSERYAKNDFMNVGGKVGEDLFCRTEYYKGLLKKYPQYRQQK